MTNRTAPPPIKDATGFNVTLPSCESIRLDNQIPVYLIQSEEQETLEIEWVFKAGSWYESSSLMAYTTNAMLKNGTNKHTALQINEMIEYYGAFLSTRCTYEYASLTLHCLEKHVGNLLPVIKEILAEAAFPENELEIYLQNKRQQLAVNLKKCDFVANQLIDKYLFGEYHPYGRHSTMEAYDVIQRENLGAFYKKHYTYNQCKIFVAGKISSEFKKDLNAYFGEDEWNGKEDILPGEFPLQPAPEKKFRIENDPDGVQGAIRIGRLFPNRYHPDVHGVQVLNTILGGYFGSRLMSNIREDKGYTYGIFSSLAVYGKAGSWSIHTEAGRNVCEAAVEEIYKEMERLGTEPVSEGELDLVRNYMIGSALASLDGSFRVIRQWKGLILSGLDEDYFYRSLETIRTITGEDLQHLAQKYFVPEDFYEIIVV